MAKVYSYRRFSTADQLHGDSLRRQTSLADAWAASRGLELDKELSYTDLGVSAFRGRNVDQGALGEFLKAIEDGLVEAGSILLVESLDRLSRQTARRALRALEGIVDAGITVVTLDNGREYTAEILDRDPMALIEIVLKATLAHDESVAKQARLRQAWIGKREKAVKDGVVLTSKCPGWLELVGGSWRVIEDRAEVVRRIFELAAQGAGTEAIAELLNRGEVPVFGRGRMWHKTYILKILTNEAVVGNFMPHTVHYDDSRRKRRRDPTGDRLENYFPAVVDRPVWDTVQALKASSGGRRSPASTTKTTVSHLLAGLAACPSCGSTMTRVTKGNTSKAGKPKLVCTRAKAGAGCEYRSVDLEAVETALIAGVDRAASEAPGPDEGIAEQVRQVEKEIAGTEDGLEGLLDALQRAPDSQALVDRLGSLEADLMRLRSSHQDLLRQSLLADPRGYLRRQAAAVEVLKVEPIDRARANAALRAAVERIVVGYQDGVLEIHWLGDGVSVIQFGWPLE
jgi:DNA invertase Pin-like site-specific DNA recombinase